MSSSSPQSLTTNKLSADSAHDSEAPLKRPARWLRSFPALGRHGSTARAACSQKAFRFRSPIAWKRTHSLSLRLHISAANRSIGTVGELTSSNVVIHHNWKIFEPGPLSPRKVAPTPMHRVTRTSRAAPSLLRNSIPKRLSCCSRLVPISTAPITTATQYCRRHFIRQQTGSRNKRGQVFRNKRGQVFHYHMILKDLTPFFRVVQPGRISWSGFSCESKEPWSIFFAARQKY